MAEGSRTAITSHMLAASLATHSILAQPPSDVAPESCVTRPFIETRWQPVRTKIRRPGKRAPLPIASRNQERMPALLRRKACKDFNAFARLEPDFIGTQQK